MYRVTLDLFPRVGLILSRILTVPWISPSISILSTQKQFSTTLGEKLRKWKPKSRPTLSGAELPTQQPKQNLMTQRHCKKSLSKELNDFLSLRSTLQYQPRQSTS